MPANINIDPNILNRIPAADRDVVHAALKAAVEKELLATTAAGGCEHSKESGPLHSKDFNKCSKELLDDQITRRIGEMEDAKFVKFASRLKELRG